MVVLAVSLMSKSGKPLISRQFVEMTRSRIEGILSAFTKLVGTEQQHTYVETDSIRYVYHPIEDLYLILVTNKQSNILEDIETLRLLSKIVPEYSKSLDEESICKAAFELIFAFDEVISLGNREILTVVQVKQYCEMESHEEKLHKVVLQSKISETKDIMKRKASEIDKSKIVKGKGDKGGGLMGISSRIQTSFSELSISKYNNGSGSGSGFGSSDSASGFNPEIESFSSKSKDRFLTSVTAPSKGLGMKLGKSKGTNQFLESLKAEGEVIPEDDAQPTSNNKNSQQARALITSSDPVTLIIEEKLTAMIKRDGGVSGIDVQGTLSLQILNQEDGLIQLEVESQEVPGLSFRTHPNISRELFNNRRIIALKDPNRPFPAGQNDVSLVKWRIQGMDETSLPLTLSCWPSVSGSETYVNIEYEASEMFDLHNVIISIPLPAIRESPSVRQIDGEWRYDSRNSTLDWSILLIDSSNLSGAMEFVVPTADDTSVFFPITVRFTSPSTFSGVKVSKILPLKDGVPPKFSQTAQIVTDTYQVV